MAIYYGDRGLTWIQYLQADSFVQDITGAIHRTGKETGYALSEQTKKLVASSEALAQNLQQGFDQISEGIEQLGAAFEWGMGLLAEQLAVQNQLLGDILQRLDAIHETLKTPTLTQAREFYNIGRERLSKGLLDRALEALLKAEEKNDADFLTQYGLAHLYLYGLNEDCNVVDLPQAEKHFRNAARYAKAEIPALPEARNYCGKAYFHASVARYLQAREKRQSGGNAEAGRLLQEAVTLAQRATEVYPELAEGFYQHAKTCALAGEASTALQSLEHAINTDRNYCLKADQDRDFDEIRQPLLELFETLRQRAQQDARDALDGIQRLLNEYVFPTEEGRQTQQTIEMLLQRTQIGYQRGTYFDYLDTLLYLQEAKETFEVVLRSFEVLTTISPKMGFGGAFSPDTRYVASGHRDGTVRLWDVASQQEIACLRADKGDVKGDVNAVAFSPDGQYLASKSDDHTVQLWDVASRQELAILRGHTGTVYAVAFSADGQYLASGSYDHTVRLWDVASRQEIAILRGHIGYRLAFSSDSRYLASGGFDGTVRLWDVTSQQEIACLQGDEKQVCAVAFSPDGRYLASAGYRATVRLWDVVSRREIAILHGNIVHTLAFSPDGRHLIVSYASGSTIQIWGQKHIVSKQEFEDRRRREQKEEEEYKRQEELRSARRRQGQCEMCGTPLGFFDKKFGGQTRCKNAVESSYGGANPSQEGRNPPSPLKPTGSAQWQYPA
jgi:WD40 repeat protein